MSLINLGAKLISKIKFFYRRVISHITLYRPYTGPVPDDDIEFDSVAIDHFMPDIQELIYEREAKPGQDFHYGDGKLHVYGAIGIDMYQAHADRFELVTIHPLLLKIESELELPFFTNLWAEITTTRSFFGAAEFRIYLIALILGLQLRFPELDARLCVDLLRLWAGDLGDISMIISLVATQIIEDNLDRRIQQWLNHDVLASSCGSPNQSPSFVQLWESV